MNFETVMKLFFFQKLALLALASVIALHAKPLPASTIQQTPIERIAFGSCADQQESLAIFDTITQVNPDIFVFLGDNVYAEDESDDPLLRSLTEAYDALGNSPAFRRLRDKIPLYATWDDHDYGLNDAGEEFRHKAASERLFETFWNIPPSDPSIARPGVYRAVSFGPVGRRVQLILLDTRSFRSGLEKPLLPPAHGRYTPTSAGAQSVLGTAQWSWLQAELAQPADVRLIASSIQVLADGHHWEAWRLFPAEQERLIRMISEASGTTLVLSGDRHLAGIYFDKDRSSTPILELTSSSLNLPLTSIVSNIKVEPGPYRLGEPFYEANFGLIEIDWQARRLHAAIKDQTSQTVRSVSLSLDHSGQ